MKVLMLEAPEGMLAERRRKGLDVRDEIWDGVLHMVPPPGDPHQEVNGLLFRVVAPLAERRGLVARIETGLFRAADDYRVPDQLYRRSDQGTERGAEGAELVVEVRSSRDETYEKMEFYAALRVREVLVVHPGDRRVELFRLVGGQMVPLQPNADGMLAAETLGVQFRTVDGALHLTWDDGSAEI